MEKLKKEFYEKFVEEVRNGDEYDGDYLVDDPEIVWNWIEETFNKKLANMTAQVDIIWSDIFDDEELPLIPSQMYIVGKYINDAKERIRKQIE